MKKIIVLGIFSLLAILVFTHNGQSKTKAYYSGDAVSFNDEVYITSANSGSLEVLKLQGNTLSVIARTRLFNGKYNRYDDFSDSKLSVENNHLYVYATNAFTLYKYEVVNDKELVKVASQANTYWEWYNRVDKFGDNIVTISAKGINVWNKDLQVVNSYNLTNEKAPFNLRAYDNNIILNVDGNNLVAYDRSIRANIVSIPLNYKTNPGNHQSYIDSSKNLYVVDDYYAKKFNLDGKLIGSFKHIDQPGYDVSASGHSEYIYFSNGLGVVKLDMNTMEESTYAWTSSLGGVRGWAMGLKVVNADGDKVVLFNNSNILVMNDKLKKIASYTATEEEADYASENLFLKLGANAGSPSTNLTINGGGYFPNEKLVISFGGTLTEAQADSRGRFTKTLIVPNAPTGATLGAVDIKVDGLESKLSYSISFKIIK